jgi:hypothetical protein
MRTRVHKRIIWLAAFWAFCAVSLCGIFGRGATAAAPPAHLTIHIAIADFDGDRRPDLVSVEIGQSSSHNTRYWIAFHLTAGPGQMVGLTAPTGGVQIASRDVNGDSFPDVIVTTAWTNQPVAILLNDGLGNFTASKPAEFQSAFAGSTPSWTAASDEIKDAVGVLPSRCSPGDFRTMDASSPAATTWLPPASTACKSLLLSVLPSIGRAPPVGKLAS